MEISTWKSLRDLPAVSLRRVIPFWSTERAEFSASGMSIKFQFHGDGLNVACGHPTQPCSWGRGPDPLRPRTARPPTPPWAANPQIPPQPPTSQAQGKEAPGAPRRAPRNQGPEREVRRRRSNRETAFASI